MQQYFPQGLASEFSFCNRDKERAALKQSIADHEHIVLVAPRRHGKTSLIMQVLKENNLHGVCIDFFFVLTQADVTKAVMEGVSKVVSSILPKTKAACSSLVDSISALNPKLTFSVLGQKLEINTKHSTEKSISEVLLALDQFAVKSNKSCVVVFDEFQQIGELEENHTIEASIRHAVERSQNVSYIFSGSKRHLLNEMFSDRSRPLYHLCDLMTIGRISAVSYHDFLNKMAKNKWGKLLSEDVIEEVIHSTERHPYYVNALCRRLWRSDKTPTVESVVNAWEQYVNQQGVWISNDLSLLTLNRRKLLGALACQPTNEPQGKNLLVKLGMGLSSMQKSLSDLRKLDLIYLDANNYFRVLDPAVAYFIRQHSECAV
ncbi:MAG: ATP-binding protein [Gammaproteobacteria bacterium]